MKFFSAKLSTPTVSKIEPEQLIQLAKTICEQQQKSIPLLDKIKNREPEKKYRLIDEIITNIEAGMLNKINLVEWVYCLFAKCDWDKINPEKSQKTSEEIWQFAQEYPPLKKRLLWHLVSFHFAQDKLTIAPSLAETFSFFKPQNQDDYITIKLIDLLTKENYTDLAFLCVNECLQPDSLLKKHSLPYELTVQDNMSLVAKIQSYFPFAFHKIKNPQSEHINFLLNTLEKLSSQHQLIAVENLLIHIAPQVASNYPKLISWVKNIVNKSSGYQLSSASKKLFKKWIGAVNYKHFSQLIDLIIDRISVDSWEDNQLMQRKIFWSNYSDRFIKMRILLPFSTIQAFGNDFIEAEASQLINDGSESTEVCIVDLDGYFIVEFFRGKGSEIRIFTKDNQLENELFNFPEISLKRLRYLTIEQENIIDHCDSWQIELEQLLRSKNIFPNEGIENFQIEVNQKGIKYNYKIGLPNLNQQQIKLREKQLFIWQKEILKLTSEAKKYCQRQDNRYKSNSVLIFKDNKSLGNQKPSRLDFID